MAFFRQFRVILWKNFILQKRKPCVTVFEILLPVAFAVLLIILRAIIDTKDVSKPYVTGGLMIDPSFLYIGSIKKFFFAPDKPTVMKFMERVSNLTKLTGIPCKDEDDLLRKFEQTGTDTKTIFGGIVVEGEIPDDDILPGPWTFKIRPVTSKDEDWYTRLMYPFFQTNEPRTSESFGGKPRYWLHGFLTIQTSLVYSIIQQSNASADLRGTNLFLNMMPYPPYHNDPFIIVLRLYFPFFLMLGFILNVLQNTKNIVYEKERRLKESMKMMGLRNFAHWSAWFTKCFLYLVVAIGLFTVLCLIPAGSLQISVIGHTDPSLFFVFLLLYALSIVAFCFAISTLFSKANIGAAASGIIFFVTFLPYFFLQSRYELMTKGQKIAACILPNIGMAFGANVIGLYEGTGEGAQWYNFHLPATVDDNFSLLIAMLMMTAVSVFLFLVTWYIDAVFPGEFGVPQKWYFPVQTSYWCGLHSNTVDFHEESNIEENALTEFFEREPTGLKQGIRIKNLRKEFGSGKYVAVAGTNLNMYHGQITVLLGHNGAGKTTTMSMLSGFLPPTSGTAIVNGFDIRTNLSDVRKCLGLCPQHDILFDSLTVKEHLMFFAMLKGYPEDLLQEEIASIIKLLGLNEKTNALSSTLSGGQKRKLSVGIALVAGSKVIILDEPTSGMDPQARREMWTILQQFKKDRTILLTTHFMDEADVLGDRIAIMAEGVVKCCGTSLFLKNKYGSGYHLTLVKNAGCDVSSVTDLIVSNIPTARTDCDIGAELTYILPNDESPKFEQLFTNLQNRMERFGIASFGISVTTMEEVFLRVGESAVDDPDIMQHLNKQELKAISTADHVPVTNGYAIENFSFEPNEGAVINGGETNNSLGGQFSSILHFNQDLSKNTGLTLGVQQFKAAVVKKMLHTWRNRTVTIVQLLLPIVFTIIALVVDKTSKALQTQPPLTLNMSNFRKNFAPYRAHTSTFSDKRLALCFNETFKGTSTLTNQVDYDQYDSMMSYFVDLGSQVGVSIYNREYVLGASLEALNPSRLHLTGYFNGQSYHSIAISLTYILNTALKYFTTLHSDVTMINYPLPKHAKDTSYREMIADSFLGFTIAFCILFGMAFLASSYVLFIIRERSSQSKHIQMVCGLRHAIFWVANFTWDFINYLLPCFCLLIVFAAFGTEAYTEERLGYVFFVLLLYGWAVLPFVYLFHFVFSTAASGFVALTMLNIFTGLVSLLAVVIMQLPDLGTEDIAEVLGWIFSVLLPNYCLGQSFLSLFTNYLNLASCEKLNYKVTCKLVPTFPCCKGTCEKLCFAFEENYLSWNTPGIGRYLLFMALQGLLYFALVFLVEYGVLRRIWYSIRPPAEFSAELANRDEDSDVAAERERVEQNGIQALGTTDSLVMENVTKSYDGYVAVERLSLGIPQNECFGLLGVNGAGKTSTFKMLTGDEIISDGSARLNGHDVKTDITKVQANLGYCPQFDALVDQLTGRETLTMFARLKGIQEKRIPSVVNELMKMLTLEQHADKLVKQYSGGNKRKLSTAISLIGDPPVIFLDEPTTGVDPAARRQLWNVLSEVRASGRTLILTSHSMEECDALCTRIAIMVNGRFLCLGSPQHLKNKFGQGYSLIARISDSAEERVLSDFMGFIESTFPNHDLVDSGNGYVNYHLNDSSVSLAIIFGTLEQAKEKYAIEDYSLSQTTLQQVFVDFARKQVPPREDKSGGFCKTLCCCCCAK